MSDGKKLSADDEDLMQTVKDLLDGNIKKVGDLSKEELANRFGFHKGTIEGPNATAPKHAELRRRFVLFASMLNDVLPNGRAKSVAFTELETASMWAHKAIAELAPVVHEPRPVIEVDSTKQTEKEIWVEKK